MPTQAPSAPNFEAIWKKAFRYAKIAGLNPSEASDIAQDVVVWYIENQNSERVFRKVNYVVIDCIRRVRGRSWEPRKAPKRVPNRAKALVEAVNRGVVQAAIVRPAQTDLDIANMFTKTLSGVYRSVFVLSHKWGMTADEISEVLGIPNPQVLDVLASATSDIECVIKGSKQE